LERCGVKWSFRPSAPNTFTALLNSERFKNHESNSDQAFNDKRVTVTLQLKSGAVRRDDGSRMNPDLAGATVDLGGRGFQDIRHLVEASSEFNDVFVTIFPIVKISEVFKQLFKCLSHGHHIVFQCFRLNSEQAGPISALALGSNL
jgi:hypothetical protein